MTVPALRRGPGQRFDCRPERRLGARLSRGFPHRWQYRPRPPRQRRGRILCIASARV